ETHNVRVVYFAPVQSYLAPYVAQAAENSLAFHRAWFDFTPREKITIFLTDVSDFGNAGAETVPRDVITLRIAPLSFAYETFTANERMNYLLNHEMAHIATSDRPAGADRLFRTLFQGK